MRDFDQWLNGFRSSIADYKYYTNFAKVHANVDLIKVRLNILNSLIGSKDIESDFSALIEKYPEVLECIPILLAKREREILIVDAENGTLNYDFRIPMSCSVEQYRTFMRETGLFELIQNRIICNLVDYVTGVEVGLDSNGRKNRGGHLMEDIVEAHLQEAGFVRDITYFKEIYISDIQSRWGIDLSGISNQGKAEKRFDFVVKGERTIYGIETNCYLSSGSKLNETARSYKAIAQGVRDLENFKFVWFTDGIGWFNARNNLRETFDVLEDLYNINDLESGIMKRIFL